uniref:Uncharacterized protein n=1 Tax=Lepeophtheirus salmonis TaxID=72036 RepID=A0A0K2TSH6_LEPSM
MEHSLSSLEINISPATTENLLFIGSKSKKISNSSIITLNSDGEEDISVTQQKKIKDKLISSSNSKVSPSMFKNKTKKHRSSIITLNSDGEEDNSLTLQKKIEDKLIKSSNSKVSLSMPEKRTKNHRTSSSESSLSDSDCRDEFTSAKKNTLGTKMYSSSSNKSVSPSKSKKLSQRKKVSSSESSSEDEGNISPTLRKNLKHKVITSSNSKVSPTLPKKNPKEDTSSSSESSLSDSDCPDEFTSAKKNTLGTKMYSSSSNKSLPPSKSKKLSQRKKVSSSESSSDDDGNISPTLRKNLKHKVITSSNSKVSPSMPKKNPKEDNSSSSESSLSDSDCRDEFTSAKKNTLGTKMYSSSSNKSLPPSKSKKLSQRKKVSSSESSSDDEGNISPTLRKNLKNKVTTSSNSKLSPSKSQEKPKEDHSSSSESSMSDSDSEKIIKLSKDTNSSTIISSSKKNTSPLKSKELSKENKISSSESGLDGEEDISVAQLKKSPPKIILPLKSQKSCREFQNSSSESSWSDSNSEKIIKPSKHMNSATRKLVSKKNISPIKSKKLSDINKINFINLISSDSEYEEYISIATKKSLKEKKSTLKSQNKSQSMQCSSNESSLWDLENITKSKNGKKICSIASNKNVSLSKSQKKPKENYTRYGESSLSDSDSEDKFTFSKNNASGTKTSSSSTKKNVHLSKSNKISERKQISSDELSSDENIGVAQQKNSQKKGFESSKKKEVLTSNPPKSSKENQSSESSLSDLDSEKRIKSSQHISPVIKISSSKKSVIPIKSLKISERKQISSSEFSTSGSDGEGDPSVTLLGTTSKKEPLMSKNKSKKYISSSSELSLSDSDRNDNLVSSESNKSATQISPSKKSVVAIKSKKISERKQISSSESSLSDTDSPDCISIIENKNQKKKILPSNSISAHIKNKNGNNELSYSSSGGLKRTMSTKKNNSLLKLSDASSKEKLLLAGKSCKNIKDTSNPIFNPLKRKFIDGFVSSCKKKINVPISKVISKAIITTSDSSNSDIDNSKSEVSQTSINISSAKNKSKIEKEIIYLGSKISKSKCRSRKNIPVLKETSSIGIISHKSKKRKRELDSTPYLVFKRTKSIQNEILRTHAESMNLSSFKSKSVSNLNILNSSNVHQMSETDRTIQDDSQDNPLGYSELVMGVSKKARKVVKSSKNPVFLRCDNGKDLDHYFDHIPPPQEEVATVSNFLPFESSVNQDDIDLNVGGQKNWELLLQGKSIPGNDFWEDILNDDECQINNDNFSFVEPSSNSSLYKVYGELKFLGDMDVSKRVIGWILEEYKLLRISPLNVFCPINLRLSPQAMQLVTLRFPLLRTGRLDKEEMFIVRQNLKKLMINLKLSPEDVRKLMKELMIGNSRNVKARYYLACFAGQGILDRRLSYEIFRWIASFTVASSKRLTETELELLKTNVNKLKGILRYKRAIDICKFQDVITGGQLRSLMNSKNVKESNYMWSTSDVLSLLRYVFKNYPIKNAIEAEKTKFDFPQIAKETGFKIHTLRNQLLSLLTLLVNHEKGICWTEHDRIRVIEYIMNNPKKYSCISDINWREIRKKHFPSASLISLQYTFKKTNARLNLGQRCLQAHRYFTSSNRKERYDTKYIIDYYEQLKDLYKDR